MKGAILILDSPLATLSRLSFYKATTGCRGGLTRTALAPVWAEVFGCHVGTESLRDWNEGWSVWKEKDSGKL